MKKLSSIHILARMVSKSGKAFQEIKADKEGKWKPGSVYVVKHIKDIVDVKGKLEARLL